MGRGMAIPPFPRSSSCRRSRQFDGSDVSDRTVRVGTSGGSAGRTSAMVTRPEEEQQQRRPSSHERPGRPLAASFDCMVGSPSSFPHDGMNYAALIVGPCILFCIVEDVFEALKLVLLLCANDANDGIRQRQHQVQQRVTVR